MNLHLSIEESAQLYSSCLHLIGSDNISKVYKDYILIISFLDAYKIFSHKNKENIITEEELLLFQKIVNILSFDDLKMEIEENPNFLGFLLKSSYDF